MKLGSSLRRKQEDLDHLGRLLEGLQLDKDILLQLKVTFFLCLTILSLSFPTILSLSSGESSGQGGEKIGWKEKMTK